GLRRIVQEPADERDPEPAEEIPTEELQQAPENHQVGDQLSGSGGNLGGATEAPGSGPDDRPQDAPTVEREPGQEVERAQHQVDQGEVAKGGAYWRVLWRHRQSQQPEPGSQHKAGERADDRDEELVPWRRRLGPQIRDAPEDEERDAVD